MAESHQAIDLDLPDVDPPTIRSTLRTMLHDRQWEHLKPILAPVYYDHSVKDIAKMMRDLYGFDANEPAYRYRFKKWGWKKQVSSATKEIIIRKAQHRVVQGKSTMANVEGRLVDAKKLKRQAKSKPAGRDTILNSFERLPGKQTRTFGDFLPFGNRIFVNWNKPFGAHFLDSTSPSYHASPFASGSTPGMIEIFTPQNPGPSPRMATSPEGHPTPLTLAVKQRTDLERSQLFLQGRLDDVVKGMQTGERRIMSKWLYQYWLFSFSTCKYWGQGPRHWTAHDLLFEEYDKTEFRSSAGTPAAIEHQAGLGGGESEDTQPSGFCQYAIHVVHTLDDSIDSPGDGAELDEGWPAAWTEPPIEERLRHGLENNDFSNVAKETLPLCMPSIVQATVKSPGELLEESFSFAIMARNQELVRETMIRAAGAKIDLSSTYPLHIATSYLDGGKNCCNVLEMILHMRSVLGWLPWTKTNVNEHQHTVLDNLMLTILKGHSRTPLEEVDQSLRREARFAGCEVDLCGRWDADSHCYRALLQRGRIEIPFRWKHKFCHTSTQAVIHCILSLDRHGAPLSDPSGLFVRRCMNEDCGLKLQLGPLHALTLATFHLAEDGCDEEDLFGMIAVLLCLLRCFVSASDKAHISMDAILKREDGGTCSHEDLTPFELSQKLPQEVARLWGTQKQQGWRIFCHILRNSQETTLVLLDQEDELDMDDYLDVPFEADSHHEIRFEACEEHCFDSRMAEQDTRCFGGSSKLGHVWAAVQAELLTHRRQHEHEPWVSPRFDMARLLECLETGAPISMPMIDDGLMKGYCRCGIFKQARYIALREMVAEDWFGNLDIWDRSTFIDVPPGLEEMFY